MSNNIAIVYGSTTGNIEHAAEVIAKNLEPENVTLFDIAEEEPDIDDFDVIIIGISTWEYGGLQEDWIEYLPFFKDLNFMGKICALFGQGDQRGYEKWFQDALKDVHNVLVKDKATIIGYWPNDGYDFDDSQGLTTDKKFFLGLSLDDDNQPELTEQRIAQWGQQLKTSIAELQQEHAMA